MPNAIISQLHFLKEDDDMLYTQMYLRHQVICHLLTNFDAFYDEISKDIKYEYGRIDSEEGPFSMKMWCEYILQDKNYCDSIFLKLVASMWGLRVTIVRTDNCAELKFRHDMKLDDADLCLLYNGVPVKGHYTGLIKVGKGLSTYKLNCKEVKRSQNYNRQMDVMERLERKDVVGGDLAELIIPDPPAGTPSEDTVTITKKEYKMLVEKSKQLDIIKKVLGGSSVNVGGDGGDGTKRKVADEGQGSQKGQKKRRVEVKFMGGEKVKDVQVGDTHCQPCNMDFPTTKSLRSHNEKCHEGKVLYQCSECAKGFMSKEGIEKHKLQHGDKKDMIPCKEPGCTVTFARKQSLKKHMKSKHGPGAGKKYNCSYCNKEVSSVDNKKAHEMGCKENKDRKELFCGLCNKGGFYLPKHVMEHKRDEHGFV